ncbi:MAG: carboxypeptidase regulatory-like domain-containing protein, partial [Polyangiales bacterium]
RSELDTMFGTTEAPTLTATTTAQGTWTATNVPPGRYSISATAKGLLPASLDKLVVAEGESKTGIDLALEAGGMRVSGTVTDVGGGPVPGARITVSKESSSPLEKSELIAMAGPDGKYEITLADGDYEANVSHEDYTHASRNFSVAGQPLTVDFVVSPGGSIRGVVVTREGKPLAGALVLAEGRRGHGDSNMRADDKGEFTLHSLGSGAISIKAAGRGYASQAATVVELGIGEQVEGVRVIVDRAFSISGTVVDSGSNKGIPGVRLGAFSIGTGQVAVAPDPSAADGAFEIVGVRPASYMMFAIGEGTMPEIGKSVEVVDKDITDLLIEMGVGVTVSGRVEPGAVAAISVEPTQVGIGNIFEALKAMLVLGESDPTGAFVLHHVPPGSFKLRAKVTDGRTGTTPLLVGTADMTGVIVKLETRGSIAGRVVDTNNAPVARVHVSASAKLDKDKGNFQLEMSGNGNRGSLTAADGTFRIVGLDEGVHEIEVSDDQGEIPCAKCKSPKEPVEVTLAVAEVKTGVVLTVEARDGVIKGIVVDKEKKPVADVWISAVVEREGEDKLAEYREMMAESRGRAPTLTADDGRFTFKDLRRGDYTLTAETAKGTARAKLTHVKLGSSVTLALAPLGTLTGKVTINGAPATSFLMSCEPMGGEPRQFTSAAGTYELERIPPGHVKCSANGDAGRGSGELEVPAGPATLDIKLAPWATITGTVVSVLTGQPIQGLKMIASGDHDESSIAEVLTGKGPTSDSAGRFTISKVAPGKGALAVMPKDAGFVELAHRDYDVAPGQRLDLGTIKVAPPRTGDAGTLGLALTLDGEVLTVSSVKPGGPAATGGVQVGDKLTGINGVPVATLTPKLAQTLVSSGSVTIDQPYKLSFDRGGAAVEVVLVGVRW